MGKLNVTVLRYLTKEDFRVLTAVSNQFINIRIKFSSLLFPDPNDFTFLYFIFSVDRNGYEKS